MRTADPPGPGTWAGLFACCLGVSLGAAFFLSLLAVVLARFAAGA